MLYCKGATAIGVLLAFAGLVQIAVQGSALRNLVARAGELRLIRLGLIAFAFGMAPMASTSSQVLLFVLLAMLSAGYGFANPSVASLISKRSARFSQGEVLGVNQSALSLARICGPIPGGFIYQTAGPVAAYVGGALAAIFALLLTGNIEAGA